MTAGSSDPVSAKGHRIALDANLWGDQRRGQIAKLRRALPVGQHIFCPCILDPVGERIVLEQLKERHGNGADLPDRQMRRRTPRRLRQEHANPITGGDTLQQCARQTIDHHGQITMAHITAAPGGEVDDRQFITRVIHHLRRHIEPLWNVPSACLCQPRNDAFDSHV